MMNHTNPNAHTPVHAGDGTNAPTSAPTPAEPSVAMPQPVALPSLVERLARQSKKWADFASSASRMQSGTIHRKALESLLFCIDERARDFAVPTKLSGTSSYQSTLRRLAQTNPRAGHPLSVQEADDDLVVSFGEHTLGCIQSKHLPWLRTLLLSGASVRFLAVSGLDRTEGYLGCNVVLSGIGAALSCLNAGHGAPAPVGHDVHLWRTVSGGAKATVTPAGLHSDTVEWGYAGSGAAELAYAILIRFVSPCVAETLYQRFKDDVIAPMPHAGGVIRAPFVVSWLCQHGAL